MVVRLHQQQLAHGRMIVVLVPIIHGLVPIMQEIYENNVNYQYAVAVIKKNSLSEVQHIRDLYIIIIIFYYFNLIYYLLILLIS